jgi:hypothetical protein
MSRELNKLTALHKDLGDRYGKMDEVLARDDAGLFRSAPEVSGWSVANQLHHLASSTALMLVAVSRIAAQVAPAEATGSITTIGRGVLLSGRFPRGKGKAPKTTVPPEVVSREDLEQALTRSRSKYAGLVDEMDAASKSAWKVAHPYFGMLTATQWLKLAKIHADHHFRIIADIDAA